MLFLYSFQLVGGVHKLNEMKSLTQLHIISQKNSWNHQNEDVCGCLIGFISRF